MDFHANFIATVIESNKDFDGEMIREYILSRVAIGDFEAMIAEFEPHVSSNDPNGPKYAIFIIERLMKGL